MDENLTNNTEPETEVPVCRCGSTDRVIHMVVGWRCYDCAKYEKRIIRRIGRLLGLKLWDV